jgi:hypothetical protein
MHGVFDNAIGPIVRINPDEIHIRDPSWVDNLYAPSTTHRDKFPAAARMAGMPLGSKMFFIPFLVFENFSGI